MPELPDVEIAKRYLDELLGGSTITRAESKDQRVLRPHPPSALARTLAGRTVREVSRRGKWLRVVLDDGSRIFSHLGMTGWWEEREVDQPAERSERARIDVVSPEGRARSARYLDSRRFGRLILSQGDIAEWTALGPDPLADGIDMAALAAAFTRTRRAVKESLMDQSVLAGIGNILATEALWHAKIDPRSPSNALSRSDVAAIVRGLRTAIRRELKTREASEPGHAHDIFSVYGRAGEPCPRDGSTLVRVVIAGRTTAFCKHCQVRKRRAKPRASRSRAASPERLASR
jgi:formamidopyrimidine-DNA glycosylase